MMRLQRLKIARLYGTLNVAVEFNERLSLLVGINGSGKTSVINAIDSLLRHRLPWLAATAFDSISVEFYSERSDYKLEATQSTNRVALQLYKDGRTKYKPITVDFDLHPSRIRSAEQFERLLRSYSSLHLEAAERPLAEFLRNLPKPDIISLDRTLAAETENSLYIDSDEREELATSLNRRKASKTPLERVQEVVASLHNSYRGRIITLNDELKSKIVISAFRYPFATSKRVQTRKMPKLSIAQVERLQRTVGQLFSSTIRESGSANDVRRFFSQAKQATSSSAQLDSTLAKHLSQISDLAEAFDEFEKKSAEAYERIRIYLKAVNRFYLDSHKELSISDGASLGFRFIPPTRSQEFHSVARLSSGERQILILLTFMAFIAQPDRAFIVDEPELSLHPKWQHDFLESFLELAPSGMQIIIATHSPEIVASNKKDCIVLQP
jgi:predicted ATP-dependent endonuclease of OLD family